MFCVSCDLFSVSSRVLLGTRFTCGKMSIQWNLSVIRCLGIRICVSKVNATFDCVCVYPASHPALLMLPESPPYRPLRFCAITCLFCVSFTLETWGSVFSSFVLFVFVQKRFYFCKVFNFGYGLQILSDRLLKGRVCFKRETVFD